MSLNKFFTTTWLHGLIALVSFALLAVAFYMEYSMGLEPCPLCMLQRIVFFCIGVVCLISVLHKSVSFGIKYSFAVVILCLMGAALSIRHLYLQNLPTEELPACLPGLSYMLEAFPLKDILAAMIMGTGECGDVVWTFLGLSIPGWTLVAFICIAVVNLVIAFRQKKLALA